MEIELAPGGQYALSVPQQNWVGESHDFQTALFAGQRMMVIRDSDDPLIFQLHFMGLMTTGFTSMMEAKLSSAAFARAVLDKLRAAIVEV
jgi:hypothetical protein